MTENDAIHEVHDFSAETKQEAQAKCDEVNAKLEPGPNGKFMPVEFPGMGWACMLEGAYLEAKKMGILT